jgi:hypothetical protein
MGRSKWSFFALCSGKNTVCPGALKPGSKPVVGVLGTQLEKTGTCVAGEAYSIADMAIFP